MYDWSPFYIVISSEFLVHFWTVRRVLFLVSTEATFLSFLSYICAVILALFSLLFAILVSCFYPPPPTPRLWLRIQCQTLWQRITSTWNTSTLSSSPSAISSPTTPTRSWERVPALFVRYVQPLVMWVLGNIFELDSCLLPQALLCVQATVAGIIYPNKQVGGGGSCWSVRFHKKTVPFDCLANRLQPVLQRSFTWDRDLHWRTCGSMHLVVKCYLLLIILNFRRLSQEYTDPIFPIASSWTPLRTKGSLVCYLFIWCSIFNYDYWPT